MLYHASPLSGLRTLVPAPSTHGPSWVYAAEDAVTALLFGAPKDDFDLLLDHPEGGVPTLMECYEGAFATVYRGRSCSLYTLEETHAQRGLTGWAPEAVFSQPVPVCAEEQIPDLYLRLCREESQGRLVVCRYRSDSSYRAMISQELALRLIHSDLLAKPGDRLYRRYGRLIDGLKQCLDGHLLD